MEKGGNPRVNIGLFFKTKQEASLYKTKKKVSLFYTLCRIRHQSLSASTTDMTSSMNKFYLKWNDFEQNIVSSYHDLRKDPELSDVTLVCEEDQSIEAHRFILTACSPFFSTVLKRNKHSHPLIYMRGIKAKDLVAIVDFIYHGEAYIHHEDLEGFLALGEELKLKGLTHSEKHKTELDQKGLETTKNTVPRKETKPINPPTYDSCVEYSNQSIVPANNSKTLVTLDENITEQINTLMENVNDGE